jgi:hypothetical protein
MSRVTSTRTAPPRGADAPVSRLPRHPEAGRRRVREGVAALLGALVLVVGVPVALVHFVGNPLPTSVPSRDWLTADVTPSLVIDVLAILVWLVWAHFCVCLLTEWRAVRAGRMPGRVAFGGGSQVLARQLVAGLLLLSGGASIAQGATVLTDAPVTAGTTVTATTTTTGYDLPAPMITPEQRAAVEAEAQHRSDQADRGLKHYEVKPPRGRNHDTLWDIAERTLGDPFRYKEIFALNKLRLQPDGSRLTDADLIRPGWQLRLPADASGPGVRLTPAPAAHLPGGGASLPAAQSGGTEHAGQVASALTDAAVDRAAAGTGGAVDGDGRGGLAELLLGGGLVLAGVLRALTARRGPYGEPDEDAGALAGAAALRRAEFLDDALRGLAEMRAAQHQPMPDLLFVYVNDEQVVLHLAGQTGAPERPWTVSEDGSSWTLHADDLVSPGAGVPAPYPSLVAVADSHGFDLLVDLEMAPGLVTLGGDGQVAREVAMSMALDLATHAWSDSVDVVMVGFGDQLGDLGTGRVRHSTGLDEILAEAEQGSAAFSAVAHELGLDGVLQGRQRGAARQAAPLVVVLSGPPTAEQAQRLSRLTGGGRTAFSALSVGDSPSARWRFSVDGAGSLDAPVLGISGTARRLTAAGQQHLESLLAAALERRAAGEAMLETTPPHDLAARVLRPEGEEPEPPTDGAPALAGLDGSAPTTTSTPEQLAAAPASVRLLGPVVVRAPGHIDEARRDLLTEAVVMVALHPDGLHEAVLKASLWPRGVEQDVVEARLADAQEWLGHDAAGRPRLLLGTDGRWHLADVGVDLACVAVASRHGGFEDLFAALRLGSGEAFSGPGRHYGWLAFAREAREGRLLVTSVARRAAELAAAKGDEQAMLEALRLGVGLVPTAEVLWRLLLRGVSQAAAGDVDTEITQMYSVLAQHGVRPEPETDALVAELEPARRGAVGS